MNTSEKASTEFHSQRASSNGPQNLVATFVRCTPAADFDTATARLIAERARPMFAGLPGLRSKLFSFNPEAREIVNVYLWESKEAAAAFFNPHLLNLIEKAYGAVPEVRFAEVSAVIENQIV